jgi:PKD domain-containing protein
MVTGVRRAVLILVAGALLAPAAPCTAAIDGVVLHRETDPAVMGEAVHFTASAGGQASGLLYYDWGPECGPEGPSYWTTKTASGGFDRIFDTAGEHSVCVRAYDDQASYSDALSFTVADPGNHPPVAALTVTPGIAAPGGEVKFSALGASDPDQDPLHYRFDIDGEPGFEVDNANNATVTQTYENSVKLEAGVQVTDPSGARDVAKVDLVVGDPNPLKVRLAAHGKDRNVQVTVTTGRTAKVHIEVRTPDASLVGSTTGRVKVRAHTYKLRLRRRYPRLVVIAAVTDSYGVTVHAVRRITVKR